MKNLVFSMLCLFSLNLMYAAEPVGAPEVAEPQEATGEVNPYEDKTARRGIEPKDMKHLPK